MLASITGTVRDWPDPGGLIDLPDAEAAQACNLGLCVPVDVDGQDHAEDGKPPKRGRGRG